MTAERRGTYADANRFLLLEQTAETCSDEAIATENYHFNTAHFCEFFDWDWQEVLKKNDQKKPVAEM